MVVNTCEMWSNGIKIAFFSKNLQKSPSGWGLCPQTPIATGGWGFRPQTLVCGTFEYTSLLTTSPKVRHLHFLTISFRPLPLPKSWLSATDYSFRSSILRYLFAPQKVPFLKISDDVIAMWFVVWAPQSKILATPMLPTVALNWSMIIRFFLGFLSLENSHLRNC